MEEQDVIEQQLVTADNQLDALNYSEDCFGSPNSKFNNIDYNSNTGIQGPGPHIFSQDQLE